MQRWSHCYPDSNNFTRYQHRRVLFMKRQTFICFPFWLIIKIYKRRIFYKVWGGNICWISFWRLYENIYQSSELCSSLTGFICVAPFGNKRMSCLFWKKKKGAKLQVSSKAPPLAVTSKLCWTAIWYLILIYRYLKIDPLLLRNLSSLTICKEQLNWNYEIFF